MKEILKLNAISQSAVDVLGADYKLTDKPSAPAAVMLRSFSMHDYDLPQSVLAVARAGAGTNNIPSDAYAERGVVGLGAIGVLVGNNAVRLGMNVLGYDPYISIDSAWKLNHNIEKTENLDELFKKSDYITLHVPLLPATRGMINAETIAKMKDGVNIINLSRGELCVNADVVDAVKCGKIRSYVTDFAAPELLGVKGITVMPHLGASTDEAEDNCAVMAARELRDFIENGNITNSVNFPACSSPRAGVCRITVIHRNVKNVIKTITDVITGGGINIENFVSRSRGEYAYTIIDAAADIDAKLLDKIDCPDILRIRKI